MALLVTDADGGIGSLIYLKDSYKVWDTVDLSVRTMTGEDIREIIRSGIMINNVFFEFGGYYCYSIVNGVNSVLNFNEDAVVILRGSYLCVYSGGKAFELYLDMGSASFGFGYVNDGFVLKGVNLHDEPFLDVIDLEFKFRDMQDLIVGYYYSYPKIIKGVCCNKIGFMRNIAML